MELASFEQREWCSGWSEVVLSALMIECFEIPQPNTGSHTNKNKQTRSDPSSDPILQGHSRCAFWACGQSIEVTHLCCWLELGSLEKRIENVPGGWGQKRGRTSSACSCWYDCWCWVISQHSSIRCKAQYRLWLSTAPFLLLKAYQSH